MRIIAGARKLGIDQVQSIFPASSEFGFMVRSAFKGTTLIHYADRFVKDKDKSGCPLILLPDDLEDTKYAGYVMLVYHLGGEKPQSYTFFDHGPPIGTATICLIVEVNEADGPLSKIQAVNLIANSRDPNTSLKNIADNMGIYTKHGDRYTAETALELEETKAVMADNIEKVIERDAKLKNIEPQAEILAAGAEQFLISAKRTREQGCWPFNIIYDRLAPSCTLL